MTNALPRAWWDLGGLVAAGRWNPARYQGRCRVALQRGGAGRPAVPKDVAPLQAARRPPRQQPLDEARPGRTARPVTPPPPQDRRPQHALGPVIGRLDPFVI